MGDGDSGDRAGDTRSGDRELAEDFAERGDTELLLEDLGENWTLLGVRGEASCELRGEGGDGDRDLSMLDLGESSERGESVVRERSTAAAVSRF